MQFAHRYFIVFLTYLGLLASSIEFTPHAFYNSSSNETYLVFGSEDSNQAPFSRLSVWESFRNKRIAFLGDSVTRYQYQDLAYFLTNRHWPKPFDKLCNEKRFGNWTKFFEYENHLMRGHELSESYRYQLSCCGGWTVCDNRQIYVPELNATLWYFLWYGKQSSPHGHFNLKEGIKNPPCKPGHCLETASNTTWMLEPAEFTYQFITHHNPDLFFINCGLHGYPFDSEYPWGVEQGKQFYESLSRLKHLPVKTRIAWKATTPHHFHFATIRESVAEELAKNGTLEMYNSNPVVIDLAQTHKAHVNKSDPESAFSFTWDGFHYNCWVYSEMNRELAVHFLYNKT